MATKAEAIDKLIDVLAGSDVQMHSQDVAGRINQLAESIEDGTITIGDGGSGVSSWNDLTDKPFSVAEGTVQLFSGEFVTRSGPFGAYRDIYIEWPSTLPNQISVVFDGDEYAIPLTPASESSNAAYGEAGDSGPIFSTYPVLIMLPEANGFSSTLYTESAGTYSVSITCVGELVETTDEFDAAVESAISMSGAPLRVVANETTAAQVAAAIEGNTMAYYSDGSGNYKIVTHMSAEENTAWEFSPAMSSVTMFIEAGVLVMHDR